VVLLVCIPIVGSIPRSYNILDPITFPSWKVAFQIFFDICLLCTAEAAILAPSCNSKQKMQLSYFCQTRTLTRHELAWQLEAEIAADLQKLDNIRLKMWSGQRHKPGHLHRSWTLLSVRVTVGHCVSLLYSLLFGSQTLHQFVGLHFPSKELNNHNIYIHYITLHYITLHYITLHTIHIYIYST